MMMVIENGDGLKAAINIDNIISIHPNVDDDTKSTIFMSAYEPYTDVNENFEDLIARINDMKVPADKRDNFDWVCIHPKPRPKPELVNPVGILEKEL